MVMKYRKRTWDDEFQEKGLYYIPGGSGDRERIKEGGSDVVEAKLLKADGDRLPEGDPAVYTTFEILEETSFAGLLTFCRSGMTNLDLITIFQGGEEDA